MKKSLRTGFTLVELIVVIIILAILGTIAFISLQGYSKDARDSTRISDLSSMKTSLEVFQLGAGKYPIPTEGVDITYSGATVWTQGTFGETVYANVNNLDKIPTDPITDASYTYSTTQNRGEYQLGGMVEGDTITFNINMANAAGTVEARAIITGTYNGQVTKSLSGSTLCNIVAVPSIIINDTSVTDLDTINTQNRFVYRGKNNLPSSFKSTKFNNEGGFNFKVNKIVAYTDTGSCTELTSKTSYIARVEMLKGIQDAYSGTTLKNEGEIKNILALDISDINNPSIAVKNYAGLFVNNNLGGSIGTTSGGGSTTSNKVKNCKEVLDNGDSIGNGIYTIYPNNDSNGIDVYCEMTIDGGGWTLLNRWITVSTNYLNKEICGTSFNFKTITNDSVNYPVLTNDTYNFGTECLYINTNTTWNNTFGWSKWDKGAHENSPLNTGFTGYSSVLAGNHQFGSHKNGWGNDVNADSVFGIWERPKNGGTCGGANDCGSKVCGVLNTNITNGCHRDTTSQKYIYVR